MAGKALVVLCLLCYPLGAFSSRDAPAVHAESANADCVLAGQVEDVRANSALGELTYLHWVIESITENVQKIADCKAASMWGSCPYAKERDLTPMFLIAGHCPGSKCKEKQAMLYAMPQGSLDNSAVQTIWTKDTVGGSGPPCSQDAANPTHHLNPCGDAKNAPSDNVVISVRDQYLNLLALPGFALVSHDGAPRVNFRSDDGRHLLLVALVVEEITWGAISPTVFKGKFLYQDHNAAMGLAYQDVTMDTSTKKVQLSGDARGGIPRAFLDSEPTVPTPAEAHETKPIDEPVDPEPIVPTPTDAHETKPIDEPVMQDTRQEEDPGRLVDVTSLYAPPQDPEELVLQDITYRCCCHEAPELPRNIRCTLKNMQDDKALFYKGGCGGAMGEGYHSWTTIKTMEKYQGVANVGRCMVPHMELPPLLRERFA